MRKQFLPKLLAVVLSLALIPLMLSIQQASATHKPADKVFASASTIEVEHTQMGPGASSAEVVLLEAVLRTSSPTDLILKVTAECALFTDLAPFLFTGETVATVKVWVEIDDVPVPVTSDPAKGGPDDGRVVFCNRDFRIDTSNLISAAALFIKTRSANAFNWAALNVGAGVHTIKVKARGETEVVAAGTATVAVGKRTLIVEPAKLANDITV